MHYRAILLSQLGWPPFWGVVLAEGSFAFLGLVDPTTWVTIAEYIAKALVAFLTIASPAIIKFVGDIRKDVTHNSTRLDAKDAEIADLKAQLARQDKVQAELGQAGLISNGDMKDPIRERAGQ